MVSEKQQHQNGGEKELKFIHDKGAEIILDGDTGKVVTDPRWRGTFNYKWYKDTAGHISFDMNPWQKYGTGPNDIRE